MVAADLKRGEGVGAGHKGGEGGKWRLGGRSLPQWESHMVSSLSQLFLLSMLPPGQCSIGFRDLLSRIYN